MRHLKVPIDSGRVAASSKSRSGEKTHQQKCDFGRLEEYSEQNSGKKLITAERRESVRKWRLEERRSGGEEKEERMSQGQ